MHLQQNFIQFRNEVTNITHTQINSSGARALLELCFILLYWHIKHAGKALAADSLNM